jgi:hypothetical protein
MTLQRIAASFLVFILGVSILPTTVHAQTVEDQYQDILDQGIIFAGICTSATAACDCRDYGLCDIEDILQVGVNVTIVILALSGTLLLFVFTYGGMVWIASNGRSDWVNKGKTAMIGGVVGVAIIFSGYAVIALIVSILLTGEPPSSGDNIEDIIGGNANTIIKTQN